MGNMVRWDYILENLSTKPSEFKPPASKCRWPLPAGGAPTVLLCSTRDHKQLLEEYGLHPPPFPCTHWATGVVRYMQPSPIQATRAALASEWANWRAPDNLKHETIHRLAAKHACGFAYRITKRELFEYPVAVRVTRRNYGDGWVRAQDLELRCAIRLPAWTGVDTSVRHALACSISSSCVYS